MSLFPCGLMLHAARTETCVEKETLCRTENVISQLAKNEFAMIANMLDILESKIGFQLALIRESHLQRFTHM